MISIPKIYYAKPSITELEVRYAADAATHGWGEQCYAYISKFEEIFAQHIGIKYAHATSSATGALHLGMAALGIGPGDEVILADTNWIASAAPIVHLGASPVFVDILSDTWCIDPDKVEEAITPRTKAIIAVHLYGNLCDMDRLEAIAKKYHVYLIEDAAEAIGSRWGDRHAGSRGIFSAFSFHGTKTITTGEGGMFVTNAPDLYEKVQILNNHGRTKHEKRHFFASVVGYKYKMSNMQAAIGCAQMERIDELVTRRRNIFFQYREMLTDCHAVSMNPVKEKEIYGYWMPTIVFSQESRVQQERVLTVFKANNIDGRAFFAPLSMQAGFKKYPQNTFSGDIYTRAINLPSYHDITEDNQKRVVDIILELI